MTSERKNIRRTLLDCCGEGIAHALRGADREIACHALRILRESLDVLADYDGVGQEAYDTIRRAYDLLSKAEFQIEAQERH